MRRVHVFISGRVQGVFFRGSMAEKAQELGFTGWVRNLRDGRVEAVIEGDDDVVDQALTWCRQGPPVADVHDVQVKEEKIDTPYADFSIKL